MSGGRADRPRRRLRCGGTSYFAAQTAKAKTLVNAMSDGLTTTRVQDVPSGDATLAPTIAMLVNPPPAIALAPAGHVAVSVTAVLAAENGCNVVTVPWT
jgi:hypothetical protein